jgi:hypothetical protein
LELAVPAYISVRDVDAGSVLELGVLQPLRRVEFAMRVTGIVLASWCETLATRSSSWNTSWW